MKADGFVTEMTHWDTAVSLWLGRCFHEQQVRLGGALPGHISFNDRSKFFVRAMPVRAENMAPGHKIPGRKRVRLVATLLNQMEAFL